MAQELHWQKSTFSDGGDGDSCVELAYAPTSLHLRESDASTTLLTTAPTAMAHLLHEIKTAGLTPGAPRS